MYDYVFKPEKGDKGEWVPWMSTTEKYSVDPKLQFNEVRGSAPATWGQAADDLEKKLAPHPTSLLVLIPASSMSIDEGILVHDSVSDVFAQPDILEPACRPCP